MYRNVSEFPASMLISLVDVHQNKAFLKVIDNLKIGLYFKSPETSEPRQTFQNQYIGQV